MRARECLRTNVHSDKVADLKRDAVTAYNCLAKNIEIIDQECNEIAAAAKTMAIEFHHESKVWIKSAGKLLSKIEPETRTLEELT